MHFLFFFAWILKSNMQKKVGGGVNSICRRIWVSSSDKFYKAIRAGICTKNSKYYNEQTCRKNKWKKAQLIQQLIVYRNAERPVARGQKWRKNKKITKKKITKNFHPLKPYMSHFQVLIWNKSIIIIGGFWKSSKNNFLTRFCTKKF